MSTSCVNKIEGHNVCTSCNHDLNPLARLPVLPLSLRQKLAKEVDTAADLTAEELEEFQGACAETFASVVEHEYYCGSYASKEQPKLKALMKSMSIRRTRQAR